MNQYYGLDQQIKIILEARRQGFPDNLIADKLGIERNDPVFSILRPEGEMPLGLKMSGIAEDWREWQFFGWPQEIKEAVIILMSRSNEDGYRRGAQQGWWMRDSGQKLKIPLDKLRWGSEPLDSARMPICGTRMTSRERLAIQHGYALRLLGLLDDDESKIQ